MKRSLLLTLMAIAGTAILAVSLVGFRLSQGGLDYSAFAHIYDYDGNTTNDFHVEVDADATNGTGPCAPVDAVADVAPGVHEVAICSTSATAALGAFAVVLNFDPALNSCVDVNCAAGDCLDDNPDANAGATLGSSTPTSPDLGTGWDCNIMDLAQPTCTKDATAGKAWLGCWSLIGPYTSPVGDVEFPLAVVTFQTLAFGTDALSVSDVILGDQAGGEIGSCNPVSSVGITCASATVNKVTPLPATDTPTPLPTNTPIPPTPTNTPVPGVRMEKDCDVLTPGVQTECNLWVMAAGCVVPGEGKGCLRIEKWVFGIFDTDSPNDLDEEPEGLGAWEERIAYDHKILDISAVADETWLESGGRFANCTFTVITENYILTSCVTKDDPAVPGQQPGPNNGDGLIEVITISPRTSDLIYRDLFRPTKDNGIVTDIIDENCEVTDTLGEWIPGTTPGGLTMVCGDVHITVRMLQGDLDLDCDVDVVDDQMVAFRYGAAFGLQLYDSWFDLEPKFTDFDIDIKDLQFVFGRNYSTCQAPWPDDQAIPVPPAQP